MPFNRVFQPAPAFSPPPHSMRYAKPERSPCPLPCFLSRLFIYLRKEVEWVDSDARSLGSTDGYLDVEGERMS